MSVKSTVSEKEPGVRVYDFIVRRDYPTDQKTKVESVISEKDRGVKVYDFIIRTKQIQTETIKKN